MNSQEFVDVISKVVLDSTVNGIQKQLERPAGRNPAKEINEMSAWYNNLEESNKQMVHKIIKMSVRDRVFWIFMHFGIRGTRLSKFATGVIGKYI